MLKTSEIFYKLYLNFLDNHFNKIIGNIMTVHAHAGKPVRPEDRINIGKLVSDYFLLMPDVSILEQNMF